MNKQIIRKSMDITPPRPTPSRKGRRPLSGVQWALVGMILLLLAGLIFGMHTFARRNEQKIDADGYQAVFLDNDQVFFGKLQNTVGGYLTLKQAYYVQGQEQNATTEQPARQAESTQLLRVSDTVYGPDDSMSIQSGKVLFWQNLENDSKVSKAIDAQK